MTRTQDVLLSPLTLPNGAAIPNHIATALALQPNLYAAARSITVEAIDTALSQMGEIQKNPRYWTLR